MASEPRTRRNRLLFALGCAVVYALVVHVVPPYTPLTEPDSAAYIEFSPFRPAYYPAFLALCRSLGLGLVGATWVQLLIFAAALAYLLAVLARSGFPKAWLALLVVVLAANPLFSSFHRSILSESITFSLGVVAVALWVDYFGTRRLCSLAGAGLALGMLIGFRLAGLGFLPLHLLAVRIARPRTSPLWLVVLIALVPPLLGAGGERALYYAVHRTGAISQASYLWFAKAAMLIGPDIRFSGPNAEAFAALGRELHADYAPIQQTVAQAPDLAVRAQISAIYEGLAQYSVLNASIERTARVTGLSEAAVRTEFARQVILQNLGGYVRLTLLNELGQWSVAAQNFPPVARALNAYADAHPADVTAGGRVPAALVHPKASLTGLFIYPAFLAAGGVTLVLAFGFVAFLVRPSLAATPAGFYMSIACFLSAMCHSYTLFISLVNEWTPRFLMAVFPHLEIIGLCVVLAVWRRRAGGKPADIENGR
jgi:hypothetical protein